MKINFYRKTGLLFLSIYIVLSCTNGKDERIARVESADYYKNLFTGEILNKSEFRKFHDNLLLMSYHYNHADSFKGEEMETAFHYYDLLSNDSTIQQFKYSIRIGNEYIIREASVEKIGMSIPQRTFLTLDGENVQIGGKQTKPIMINLWFVGCVGCEQELPSLNKLQEKYADKVNFISMTFDNEKRVANFLTRKKFNFKHVINVDTDYIKQLEPRLIPKIFSLVKRVKLKI